MGLTVTLGLCAQWRAAAPVLNESMIDQGGRMNETTSSIFDAMPDDGLNLDSRGNGGGFSTHTKEG